MEGGVCIVLEELVTDGATGVTLNASYLEHKSPTVLDYPDIRVIFADEAEAHRALLNPTLELN